MAKDFKGGTGLNGRLSPLFIGKGDKVGRGGCILTHTSLQHIFLTGGSSARQFDLHKELHCQKNELVNSQFISRSTEFPGTL